MMMENVAIIEATRTPIGRANKGSLRTFRPDDLGAVAIKEVVSRAKLDPSQLEDVIVGCAMPEAEQGMNVARIMSLRAGFPVNVSAATINRFCSSGLHAVADIAKSIAVGQISCGIGAGVESMSMIPMGGHKPSANPYLMDHLASTYTSMGLTAENVAEKFNISRERADAFALESHVRATNAIKQGLFKDEIVPVKIGPEQGQPADFVLANDEGPRADTTLAALASLRPAFKVKGTVTAGNSSQVSDGAAAVVLMEKKRAASEGKKIRAYFRAFVTAGVDPAIMGIGPVPAIKKLLDVTKISLSDVGIFELNEAFAAQIIYCIDELKLDPAKVNPLGGAIALGHPLGCTGARQIATIVNHMQRNGLRFGVTAMCVGGGMGAASLIELA
jgi:acetyl-CoA acyltransferase